MISNWLQTFHIERRGRFRLHSLRKNRRCLLDKIAEK